MSDRTTLKTYFNTGDKPTEVQFADLIDSLALTTEVSAKQNTLVSGTNIKTINGASVVGSGNISFGIIIFAESLFDVPGTVKAGDLVIIKPPSGSGGIYRSNGSSSYTLLITI